MNTLPKKQLVSLAEIESGSPLMHVISPAAWQGVSIPPRDFLVEGVIPNRNVTLLSGDGGDGKTLITLQLMASVCRGLPWVGAQVKQVKAFGLFCEDEEDELHRRIEDISTHCNCGLSDLAGISLTSRVGEDNILVEFDRQDRAKPTALYHAVTEHAVAFGAQLVVLDSLHDLFGGNEIIRTQARTFIGYLRRLALAINGAVVVNAHPSASGLSTGSGTSGSTAWNNAVRSRLYLTRPDDSEGDDDARVLKTMKQNYGPRGGGIDLRWMDGVFVRSTPVGADPYQQAEKVFLECLDKIEREGRYVSPAKTSQQFAPTIFSRMETSKRLGRKKLNAAMESLFAQDKIRNGEHVQPNRHKVNAIVRAE